MATNGNTLETFRKHPGDCKGMGYLTVNCVTLKAHKNPTSQDILRLKNTKKWKKG